MQFKVVLSTLFWRGLLVHDMGGNVVELWNRAASTV
jgi:hypothetical protein